MKRVALYARVSTADQHVENQFLDLRKLATQRGFEVVREYCDQGISGSKARRPGLDSMMADARRGEVLPCAHGGDIRPHSEEHQNFLEIVDELHDLEIEFISAREAIDTSTPLGKMFVTLIGSIAELEKSILVERIRAGMRRAKLEGQRLGRAPLDINHDALVRDRLAGMSLTNVAKKYGVSRASVVRFVREAGRQAVAA